MTKPASKFFRRLLLAIFCFSNNLSLAQTSPLTLEQIVSASGFIFSGKVASVWSERDAATGFIVTYSTVAVDEAVRGVNANRFTFKQYGGSYKGQNVFVADMSYFTAGEEVVAFLYPLSKLGLTSPIGVAEGKWTIQRDPATGKKFVAGNLNATKILAETLADAAPAARIEYNQFIKLIRTLAARERQP